MKNIIQYFPAAINRNIQNLDTKVLRWAWSLGLFEAHAEVDRCRKQKINWFAGYLFPGEDPEKLELIMRFFLCLFLLDDLLDNHSEPESMEFLNELKYRIPHTKISRLRVLGITLLQTQHNLGKAGPNQNWEKEWMETWENYISGLHWEVENKFKNHMPLLEDYRVHRPYSSGVFLAIHLLRTKNHSTSCEAAILEHDIARLICLSNDLASYDKEFAIGDFNNELIILKGALGKKVQSWAIQEIRFIQKRIFALGNELVTKSETCRLWVESLFLLVGGCLAWSEETSRYVVYVNGTLKSS